MPAKTTPSDTLSKGRIEERAEGRDLLRQAGQGPVEHVETPGHQKDDARIDQVVGDHQARPPPR